MSSSWRASWKRRVSSGSRCSAEQMPPRGSEPPAFEKAAAFGLPFNPSARSRLANALSQPELSLPTKRGFFWQCVRYQGDALRCSQRCCGSSPGLGADAPAAGECLARCRLPRGGCSEYLPSFFGPYAGVPVLLGCFSSAGGKLRGPRAAIFPVLRYSRCPGGWEQQRRIVRAVQETLPCVPRQNPCCRHR